MCNGSYIKPGSKVRVVYLTTRDKEDTWIQVGQVATVVKVLCVNPVFPEYTLYSVNFDYAFRKDRLLNVPDGYEDNWLCSGEQIQVVA